MIVLLPVSRYRITYEVAAGRPFSQLERLLLRAIQEGAGDLAKLQKIFGVHPRLLIEGLVTLTQAGWLAVGRSDSADFLLTSEGREAADSDRPPSTIVVSSRRTIVLMERLMGGVIPSEVRFETTQELGDVWNQSLHLRPEVSDNRLDEGQVQHLLPRKQGEWVRWIGPIDMLSKDAHWLPLNVDVETGSIVGLPDAWLLRLRSNILDEAKRFASSLSSEDRARIFPIGSPRRAPVASSELNDSEALRFPPNSRPVLLTRDDFCYTNEDHEHLLTQALEEARGSILIASAFANIEKLEAIRSQLVATLERGVNLDLLWGYTSSNSDERAIIDWLKKFSYDTKRKKPKGVVRFNQTPSGSHAKLLIWDTAIGVKACVGSYNWLSALVNNSDDQILTNVSVCLSDAAITSALARCAAAWWSATESGALSSAGDRWRRIASELDSIATRAPSQAQTNNATARIVLDRDHETLLAEWTNTSQNRLLIASHKLGPASEPRLIRGDVKRSPEFSLDICYGQTTADERTTARITNLVKQIHGNLKLLSNLHAKVVISDDAACISSYNFLSADPFGNSRNARELGIALEGWHPAEWVWQRLRSAL